MFYSIKDKKGAVLLSMRHKRIIVLGYCTSEAKARRLVREYSEWLCSSLHHIIDDIYILHASHIPKPLCNYTMYTLLHLMLERGSNKSNTEIYNVCSKNFVKDYILDGKRIVINSYYDESVRTIPISRRMIFTNRPASYSDTLFIF